MELIIFIMMNVFLRIDPTNATDATAGPVVFTDCPNQITLEIRGNQATIDAHWDEPVVENAVEMQNNYESGHEFPIGTRTVNYTAIGVNETAECLFNVVVKDKEPPLFVNCDKTINIEIPNGQQSAAVSWMLPAAIDNADVSVNMTPTALRSPGDVFKYGPTKLKYYATDSFCNEGSCDLIINLYWANFSEDQPRIHDCPDDVEFLITNSSSTANITWTPPTTDMEFSSLHPEPDIASTIEPGFSFPLGITIVEYVASVNSGGIMRYNLCTFTVRILDRYPTQVIEKINPDPEPTIQGLPTATVMWQAPVFEDQRPFTVSASNSALSGVFNIGTSYIKYSTDDGDCNTDDASATIVITVYDWEDPIISECPSNQTTETNMGLNNKRVYYSEPSIFDNSGHYSVSWTRNSGQRFYIGLTQVTLTASDPSGNQDECYFYVKVYDYEPPTMVCADVTVPTSPGLATGVATYGINSLGITDNSQQPVDHVTSIASGSVFDLGATSVDVNATDLYGNSNDCTFDVIVEDREAPVFAGCPSNLEAVADDGLPTHSIGWTEPTATDNTDPNPSIESDVNSGILFYIGSTLVTYTATDTYSNVALCTFSVVIIDDQPPIITNCPGDQTISTDPGMPTGATTWSDATLFDNSLGQIDVSWSTAKNSAFVIGSTTVTLTATDESDNEASCDFTIHVYDNEPPVLTCPDVTAPNDFRLPSAVVTWIDPGATDNSGLDVTLTSSIPSGSNFVLGNAVIEYNGTDPFGNMETYTFTVTVEDTESPYFTFCPDDISNSADPGVWNNAVDWTDPVASDNSGNEPHVVSNFNSGDVFNIGNTTVEYKATDDDKNPNTTCSFNIQVIDYEAPIIINCPANQTIPTDHRMPTGATTWTDATLNDNSLGEIDFWWSIPKNTDFQIGLTTVTLTASDESGNEETCNFYINVYDIESPVLTCTDVTVQNAYRLPSAVVTWADPSATDNSGLDVTLTFSIPSGSNFALGQRVVEYNGTDPFGNVGNCSFVVTVEDTESPYFTLCPEDISNSSDPGLRTHSVVWPNPIAQDNSGNQPHVVSNYNPGDTFSLGVTVVVYKATDNDNNPNTTCSFQIEIIDYEIPVITNCPGNQTIPTDHRMPTAVATWVDATLNDNSLGEIDFWWSIPKHFEFQIGLTVVNLTARDESGNEETCEFYINVYDNESPVLTCTDVTVQNAYRLPSAVVTWTDPVATDNSGLDITLSFSISSGSNFTLGQTVVEYDGTDPFGNVGNCSFVVTVEDTESPYFTYCPGNITNSTDLRLQTHSVVWPNPIAQDNSGNQPHVVSNYNPGDIFILGVTVVVYKATDNDNNPNDTCSFEVEIIDVEPPVISNFPANTSLPTDYRLPTRETTWNDVVLFDNSLGDIASWWNIANGSVLAIGPTHVFLTARDESGNEAICKFYISIIDDELPVLTCPQVSSVENTYRLPSGIIEFPDPVVTDNSGLYVNLTASITTGSAFHIGDTVVHYNGTDPFGNIGNCSFIVTVLDTESPYFTYCPGNITNSTDLRLQTHSVVWPNPIAQDNSGNQPHVVSNYNPGDIFSLGVTVVVYKATDDDNNQNGTCSFEVEIIDTEPPLISNCPSDISLPMNYRKPTRNTTWNDVVLFDNSLGNIDSWWNRDNGSAFEVGSTRVFLTARDESGNEAICEFHISIYDDELPQFTYCPGDIYLSTRENEHDEIAVWNVSTAIDNSGIAPIVRGTSQPGDLFSIGISTVTYTATDSFLNNNTCSFKIYVFDNENPQFITCAPDVIIANEFRRDGAVVEWTEPIVWDNSLADMIVTSSFVSGHYFTLGLTTVEYMAIDNHNNTASCSFNVTVNDTEKPTFQNCPGNFSHPTDYRLPSAVVTWSALVSEDNSGHDPNVTSNYDPGDIFLIGVYEINYWSEDLTGNKELCSFHLHVFDNESPVFTFCPSNIPLNPMFFRPSAVANWSEPTVEDNSNTVKLVTSNYNSFDVFPIGMTWVIYQAFDRANNFENCSFSVTVVDIAPPVWHNCSDDVIVTTDYRRPDVNISWHVPTAIDDSGYSPTVVSNYKPGDILLLGLTGVSYMATDNFQNKAECNFTVVVLDEEPPYFIDCPVDFIYFVDDTVDYGNPSWVVPNTTDNSGVRPLVTASHQPYDAFPVNTTLVNYTSIDDDYNVGTCQFYITLLHTFNYLLTLNFENITCDEVDLIVEISMIAVENLDGRKLDKEEETTLLLTLDVLLEDNSETSDQESSQSQVVGATLISEALIQPIQKKALAAQLEIISNVEEIFLDRTPDVIVNASFTYESADVAVSMHPLEPGDRRWFHFYKEDSKVHSKDSDSKRIVDNGKAFVRLKSDGIGEDESIGLMMSYFDRSVFKSSSADEIVNYIQPKSGDTTEYQLQSGVLVCKVMGNTNRYSTEVEFAMVVDVKDELIKLVERAICVSWNEQTERWSEDGCRLVSSGLSELVECYCSHTSIFGILLPTELEDDNELFSIMIRVVTYCTGIASIVSLIVVAIIMLRLQKHKLPFDTERVFVMANLIISTLLMMLLYVCTLELSDDNITCIVVGVILQCLYISMVMWIFVDVFNLFTKLYNMKGKHAAKYHFALAWGVSGFFTFLFFGTYRGYEDTEGCWTDMEMGVIAAFATPTLLILLTSTIMTLVCLTCKTKLRGKRKENCVMQCRGIMICISLFLPLFLTIWAISIQVSEGDIYQMLFFGGFGLHGVFISGYVYYNFRYVERARTSSMNVHMVEDDHKEDANDDVNAADNEAIMKSASLTTEDGYDEIDRAIENQLTLSPSIHSSRALLLSESRQNSISSPSLKLSNKVSPTTDKKLPRKDPILTLPGAVPDDIVEEESAEIVESDSIEKEPASESSDGKSAKSATSQNKEEEESDSSDEDEESENESSSDSSETEINEKSNDSSEDEDDD